MGRISQLGGAILGAAVALDAGEALSQSTSELPKKGYLPTEVNELQRYRYAMLDEVGIFDEGDTRDRMVEAEQKGQLVRRNGEQVFIYWEMKPLGMDPASGEPMFEFIQKGIQRECIAADNYTDTFKLYGSNQTVIVLDREDQFDHVACPEPVVAATKVVITPPTPTAPVVATPEYVPHPGEFSDLEPKLVEQGIFLVPVRELGITEEVPVELIGPAYTTQTNQSKGKRIVYRQYVLDGYEPKTGMVRVHDGGNVQQCVETASYEDKMLGDKTSYILSVPGSPEMKDVACKEEAASKPVVETTPKESKPWELPVRAGLSLGADVEETSPYSLGNAPALHLSAQTQPFAFPLELGLSGDFIFTGEGSGLEGLDLMVGGRPFKKVPVGVYLTIGDSFEARDRYKETTLNGAFSYGAKVEGDVYEFSLLHQALAVNCHVNAQQHLYGGGGLSVWNAGGGCGLAWDYVVSGGAKEKAVAVVAVETKPKGPHLEMETEPYPHELPTFKETKSEEKKAELVRLSEEMQKRARDNKWDAVELRYDDAMKLGIPLSYRDHKNGAEAARAAGNMEECYERLLIAQTVAINDFDKKEVVQWIEEIEASYARVEIVIKADGVVTLEVSQMPFPPDQRAAITFAQAEVADGSFEGLLPLIVNLDGTEGTYTLNGQTIKISDLRPLSTKTTTEIRLEK